jgi:hypothetical protein
MRARSAAVSSTSSAATLSSRYVRPLRAWDRHDVVAPGEHPRQRELRGRAALLVGDLLDLCGEPQVLLEVVAAEPRPVAAEVVAIQIVGRREAPGEKPAAKR